MSLPLVAIASIGITDSAACENPLLVYLIIAIVVSVVNILFAIFLFNVVTTKKEVNEAKFPSAFDSLLLKLRLQIISPPYPCT